MSRSIKKNMGGKITSASSDKRDKRIWHKAARGKINKQLKELEEKFDAEPFIEFGWDEKFDEPTLNFIPQILVYEKPFFEYKDGSHFDTWGWDSDGGSYLQYTDKQLIEKFNEELNSQEDWELYLKVSKTKIVCSTWWFRLMIYYKNLANKIFKTKEEMDNWMIKNQNYLINVWKKIHWGK